MTESRITLPQDIILGQSGRNLLERMLQNPVLDGWAVDERSQPYQVTAPVAFEIAEGYYQLARMYYLRALIGDEGFVAFGPYLDELGDQEMGVQRRGASPARIAIEFSGTSAATVAANTAIATATQPSIIFRTTTATILLEDANNPGTFTTGALADCTEPGIMGNVPAASVTRFIGGAPPGVTAVNNASGVPVIEGAPLESDVDYRTRLLRFRRDPPNGANAAQYRVWAEEVPGVGRAECVRPLEPVGPPPELRESPEPGTVWVFLTGPELVVPLGNGLMVPQAVVDQVQMHIAPPRPAIVLPPGSLGPFDLDDDDAGGLREAPLPYAEMTHAGMWMFRPSLSLQGTPTAPPTTPVVTVEAFNVTTGEPLPARPPNQDGSIPPTHPRATRTLTLGELSALAPVDPAQAPSIDFFWDGFGAPPLGQLRVLRISRTAAQAAAGNGIVRIEGGWVLSAFADPAHEGRSPVNMRVECYAARSVPVDVEAEVRLRAGWTLPAAEQWVTEALEGYLRSIVFAGANPPVDGLPDRHANDVALASVAAILLGGCEPGRGPLSSIDVTTLRLNGAQADVEVWTGDVGTLRDLTLTVVP
jgi:hypothetical protein